MSDKNARLSYKALKALSLKYYGTGDRFDELADTAVNERGGHCRSCQHCIKLFGVKPQLMPRVLRQENISVRVSCSVDAGRRSPFQDNQAQPDSCTSLRRYLHRQARSQLTIVVK